MMLKMNSLFLKPENTILESIRTYEKALIEDINLAIRLKYGQQTYITRIIEWTESIVIFEAPIHETEDVMIPQGLSLEAVLVSKLALFHTTFLIQKSYRQENKLYYVAEIISPIIKRQQREAFRLDVILDVQYELLSTTNVPAKAIYSNKGTCINISLGGMCLVSDQQFHTKDQLALSFSLVDIPLQFRGAVLFLGEKTDQGNYVHRIRFINLSKTDENQLSRLIFEKQRLQLKTI